MHYYLARDLISARPRGGEMNRHFLGSFYFLLFEFHCTCSISYKILTYYVFIIVFCLVR